MIIINLGNADVNVVLFPFEMENLLTIGTMNKAGDINFNFPKELPKLSKAVKESMSSELWCTLFSQCMNGVEMVSEKDNIFSFITIYLSLSTKDNPYVDISH